MTGSFSLYDWLRGSDLGAQVSLRLYTSRSADLNRPTIADFTECAFPGYSHVIFPNPPPAEQLDNGAWYLGLPLTTWICTIESDAGRPVLGVFIVAEADDDSSWVLSWRDLEAPVDLAVSGNISLLPFSMNCNQYEVELA